jgi:NAD+ synthase
MTRNFEQEIQDRIAFIRGILTEAHAEGIVYGNSGGKDSALTGILCKKACANTVGLILPCATTRNYAEDAADAELVAEQFHIATRRVDLTAAREALIAALQPETPLSDMARINLAPRIRMTALYAVAASENRLVSGTGNRSEIHLGYFTKWGDGAADFNPIGDLTVTEIYEFLTYLGAPQRIIDKAPSAGLFDGQSDESEMGISYAAVDRYILQGEALPEQVAKLQKLHQASEHKRALPLVYGGV